MVEKTLPVSEVWLWLEHLQTVDTNRKRGATKAALAKKKVESIEATHSLEPETSVYKCGVCQAVFQEETEEEELWVGCESCARWFHAVCVNIDLQCVVFFVSFVCKSLLIPTRWRRFAPIY